MMNILTAFTGLVLTFMPLAKVSYADFVNTSIGVTDKRGSNCVIGPMLPYGSINPSPQTFKGGTDGYDPAQPIDGFAQLHVSGTGWSSYGHFLVQPQTGVLNTAPGTHSSDHSQVVSKPYLFSTTLERYGVKVEVAPSHYSAIYRFTYPESDSSSILFDASQSIARDIATYMGGTLKGNEVEICPETGSVKMRITISAGWPYGTYDLYSVAYINKKMETYGVWEDADRMEGQTSIFCDTVSTTHKGAWCAFKTKEGESVILKLAISFTGYEKADDLLRSEIPGWDFDKVASKGRKEWNRKLSSVRLNDVAEEQMTLFYSALYRVFTLARDRSLDNSKWESDLPFWDDNYAYWDTFRTAFPLLLLLDQKAYRDNILSMIDRFDHNGCVYDGFIAGMERVPEQGGNDVDCIISDGFVKGVKGVDWEKAYEIVKHNADNRRIGCHSLGASAMSAPKDLAYTRYKELGYIPTCKMSTSQTLEFAYNDFCAALMAEGLGHGDDAERWLERSHKWVALWNPDLADGEWTGFLDGRDEDGTFQNIDPRKYGGSWVSPFYEGSAWTYNYFVPHDFDRMIELMGGDEVFVKKLKFGFENHLVKYDNEPGFLASRAFVHAGRPDLSSYWVHHSMSHGFDLDGYPGNEDTGAMGSWFVFCNLGLCPNAGQDFYYLNAPLVSRSKITLADGKKLKIIANASKENVYIKSCRINGKEWNSAILPHSVIAKGGRIEFELSSEPTDWGKPGSGLEATARIVAGGGTIHRFFDTSPISPSGKYIALFRLPYEDRYPSPGDAGEVIVKDLRTGTVVYSEHTCGWETQLGANVQWGASDRELFFNDVDTETWEDFAFKVDFRKGKKEKCAGSVFMVSPDGKKLLSYDLRKSRFAQSGYGVIVPDSTVRRNVGPVGDDGIYVTDLDRDTCVMIASIKDIYERTVPSISIPDPEMYEYYCFQVKWNPHGTKLLTTVQWTPLAGGARRRAVITMNPDGSDIRTAITPDQWWKGGHHINWMPDGEHLSMNLNIDGVDGVEIVSVRYDGSDLKQLYPTGSGHPSLNPNGSPYIITDAYSGEIVLEEGLTPIRLINYESQTETNLAEVNLPPIRDFGLRVDAHPAWDRTGRYVIFNGVDNGRRCVFIAGTEQ